MSSEKPTQPTFASFYDFYDGPCAYRDRQSEMYRSLASESGGPVLELACGTGLITIRLARAGFDVTGLDIAPDMLKVAREKIESEEPAVRTRIYLVEGDMKGFALDRTFGFIFIPSNSFCYLTEPGDRLSCLRAVTSHLPPGGLLAIEERNYTPELLMTMLARRGAHVISEAAINPLTGKYTTFGSVLRHIDFASQTIYERHLVDETQEDGTVKRYVRQPRSLAEGPRRWETRHYFNRFELELLMEKAGFAVRHLWGSFDRQAFNSNSNSMIFVAEKVKEPDTLRPADA